MRNQMLYGPRPEIGSLVRASSSACRLWRANRLGSARERRSFLDRANPCRRTPWLRVWHRGVALVLLRLRSSRSRNPGTVRAATQVGRRWTLQIHPQPDVRQRIVNRRRRSNLVGELVDPWIRRPALGRLACLGRIPRGARSSASFRGAVREIHSHRPAVGRATQPARIRTTRECSGRRCAPPLMLAR